MSSLAEVSNAASYAALTPYAVDLQYFSCVVDRRTSLLLPEVLVGLGEGLADIILEQPVSEQLLPSPSL